MKIFHVVLILIVWVAVGTTLSIQHTSAEDEKSHRSSCVGCHTNLRKLIKLIWKIEATRPMPPKSQEISGEG